MILLFVQQKCEHGEMAFLTSRSVNKLALGVNPTPWCAVNLGGGSNLTVKQTIPFVVSCETSIHPCSLGTQV